MPSHDNSTREMDFEHPPKMWVTKQEVIQRMKNEADAVEVRLGIRIQYLEQSVKILEKRLDQLTALVDVMKQF